MKTKISFILLLFVAVMGMFSCQKSDLDADECLRGKVLLLREYCENTFLVQLTDNKKGLGKTVQYEGQTFHNVIKIAGGSFTLYDNFGFDGTIFFKLRTYDPEADSNLIAMVCAAVVPMGPRFEHVPIYVATTIGLEQCP